MSFPRAKPPKPPKHVVPDQNEFTQSNDDWSLGRRPVHSRQSSNTCRPLQVLTISRNIGPIELEYFDCGAFVGRGGAILFYFLVYNITHKLTVLSADVDIDARVEILRTKKGGLLTPQWPVVYHGNVAMVETNAILRYFAKILGEYGSNNHLDYKADVLVDKLAYWRDTLSACIGDDIQGATQKFTRGSTVIQNYLTNGRKDFLDLCEKFLVASDTKFFLSDQVGWIDPVVMALLYEDSTLVWQFMADRLQEVSEAPEIASKLTTAESTNPTVEPQTYDQVHEEAMYHLNILDRYPKCTAFMDNMKDSCPLLGRWLEEHRSIWCNPTPKSEPQKLHSPYRYQTPELQRDQHPTNRGDQHPNRGPQMSTPIGQFSGPPISPGMSASPTVEPYSLGMPPPYMNHHPMQTPYIMSPTSQRDPSRSYMMDPRQRVHMMMMTQQSPQRYPESKGYYPPHVIEPPNIYMNRNAIPRSPASMRNPERSSTPSKDWFKCRNNGLLEDPDAARSYNENLFWTHDDLQSRKHIRQPSATLWEA